MKEIYAVFPIVITRVILTENHFSDLNQRSAIEYNPIFKGKFKRFRAGNRYILKANWSTHQKYKVSNSFFSLLDAFILYKVNFLSRFHPVIEIIILTIISTFQP